MSTIITRAHLDAAKRQPRIETKADKIAASLVDSAETNDERKIGIRWDGNEGAIKCRLTIQAETLAGEFSDQMQGIDNAADAIARKFIDAHDDDHEFRIESVTGSTLADAATVFIDECQLCVQFDLDVEAAVYRV